MAGIDAHFPPLPDFSKRPAASQGGFAGLPTTGNSKCAGSSGLQHQMVPGTEAPDTI
jgi:hypothetical protein